MSGELGVSLMFGIGALTVAILAGHLDKKEHPVLKIALLFTTLFMLQIGLDLAVKFAETITTQLGNVAVIGYWLMTITIWLTFVYFFIYLLVWALKSLKIKREARRARYEQ